MINEIGLTALALAVATAAGAMGRRPPKDSADEPVRERPAERGARGKTMTAIQEWKGQMGGGAAPGHKVVTDAAEWKALWAELGKDAPDLDFDAYSAVAVILGEKPTGGYTAVFDKPVEDDGNLIVRYRLPKPTGFTTQAFAYPWKVIAVPKPKGRVIVEYEAP